MERGYTHIELHGKKICQECRRDIIGPSPKEILPKAMIEDLMKRGSRYKMDELPIDLSQK